MADTKPPTPPREEEAPQVPPAPPAEGLDPALTLKGAGGLGVDRLGPWFRDSRTFLQEVGAEFKKISWPTRQQIAVETGVVILISSLLTGLVMGYDWVFTLIANRVFYGH